MGTAKKQTTKKQREVRPTGPEMLPACQLSFEVTHSTFPESALPQIHWLPWGKAPHGAAVLPFHQQHLKISEELLPLPSLLGKESLGPIPLSPSRRYLTRQPKIET